MSAMLFLLPLLLCGVHSKHFLIETQDTDDDVHTTTDETDGSYAANGGKPSEGLMSQEDVGASRTNYYGSRTPQDSDGNGRRQGNPMCPWCGNPPRPRPPIGLWGWGR